MSEETVKIELHTIATFNGKEYKLEELMNGMFKRNTELHSIIKEVREYNEQIIKDIKDFYRSTEDVIYSGDALIDIATQNLEILDKVNKED